MHIIFVIAALAAALYLLIGFVMSLWVLYQVDDGFHWTHPFKAVVGAVIWPFVIFVLGHTDIG
jgi:hypothetical protein